MTQIGILINDKIDKKNSKWWNSLSENDRLDFFNKIQYVDLQWTKKNKWTTWNQLPFVVKIVITKEIKL